MANRKRKSKKKLTPEQRFYDARRWLNSRNRPPLLVGSYSKRYSVPEEIARSELCALGFTDDVRIQDFEAEGIEWEFKVEPLSGEMVIVRKGTQEHELYF